MIETRIVRRFLSANWINSNHLERIRGLTAQALETEFGPLPKDNDIVDATLLHAVRIGAADFLVTEDRRLHDRARRHSPEIAWRVLFVADAVQLLRTTYEPIEAPVRFVEEVAAHTIPLEDEIFDSLRENYSDFDKWWQDKCIRGRRSCWVVDDGGLAGLIVRKDESANDTDATTKAAKILKICTFKVRPEKRGIKLGELLLKKVFWFAQQNGYNLAYITTYTSQVALIELLEYYGFRNTATKLDGELIYEKSFSRSQLNPVDGKSNFDVDRDNYPRFITRVGVRAFGVPIREEYHDTLYPDLKQTEPDLFEIAGLQGGPKRPGNTIRKVYLCRSQSRLGPSGSILFFYKGKSKNAPSQAMTSVGVLEGVSIAHSTKDLMHFTGGRSVYSERALEGWKASAENPVKVINYLLAGYIDPPISLSDLLSLSVFTRHPPQSIFEITRTKLDNILPRLNLGFEA